MSQAKRFKTGVVIGKFYPPHLGHHLLIDTAISQVDEVSVIVCARADQDIPGHLRRDWLQEIHPGANVFLVDDTLEDETLAWARFTLDFLGQVPEAVFTSEDYGEPYAAAMGSTHVSVDRARVRVPISGTAIRKEPFRHFAYLRPAVQAWFKPRICLVGAESTGKTTLAEALAAHYSSPMVPEYAREYCARVLGPSPFGTTVAGPASVEPIAAVNGVESFDSAAGSGSSPPPEHVWTTAEFLHIAREHAVREDTAALHGSGPIIVDTDAFATTVWHRRYLGFDNPELENIAALRRSYYDLYILCDVDIPWIQDGTRDGHDIRTWMYYQFRAKLEATGRPWVLVSGGPKERLTAAIREIDRVLAGLGFTPRFSSNTRTAPDCRWLPG